MVNRNSWLGVYEIVEIIRRVTTIMLHSVLLLTHRHHDRLPCFTSLDTLVPCVLKFSIASRPTVTEPRTATSATAEFIGFSDGATCEAYGADGRRRGD